MVVLWITNDILPEASAKIGGAKELKGTGSWMLALSDAIVKESSLKLVIASVSRKHKRLTRIEGEKITYYLLPGGKKGYFSINHALEPYWLQVREEVKPDVIHIHGTEYTHGLAWIEACGAKHVCVSIQGIVSGIYNYFYYGLTEKERCWAKLHYTLFHRGIIAGARSFKQRGKCEKELLKRVNHIVGRTSWDRGRTWAINPQASYHLGGEILRKEFYMGEKWSYEKCTPHRIFLSQAGYPVKGLQMVLRAMPLVLLHYPNTTLRVAGKDSSKDVNLIDFIKAGDFHKIIRNLIKTCNMNDRVVFTGPLNAEQMKREYLNCNVFICPSSIENSPNSIGEAQILGVPVISSCVGGVMDMMKGDEDHLYRFEEVEMLAKQICDLFSCGGNLPYLEAMRDQALNRHHPQKIVDELFEIYHEVIKE